MNGPGEARVRIIDYDARRDPKTPRYCVHCQRDLSPNTSVRFARVVIAGGMPIYTIHPDDVHGWTAGALRLALDDGWEKHGVDDLGWMPFGNGCARTHGMEWTIPEDPAKNRPTRLPGGSHRLGPMLIVEETVQWSVFGDRIGDETRIGDVQPSLAAAVEAARDAMAAALHDKTAHRKT